MSLPDQSASDRKDYGERIKRHAKLLLRLIDDILDLSKVEAGKLEIEKNVVGLGLELSRRLARALGGDVTLVDSWPGVGSAFEILIALEGASYEARSLLTEKTQNKKSIRLDDKTRLAGCDAHLSKPIGMQSLLELVQRLVIIPSLSDARHDDFQDEALR